MSQESSSQIPKKLTEEEREQWFKYKRILDISYAHGEDEDGQIRALIGTPHPDTSEKFRTHATRISRYLADYLHYIRSQIDNGLLSDDDIRAFLNLMNTRGINARRHITDVDRWNVITRGTSPRAIAASIAKNYRNVTGRGNR